MRKSRFTEEQIAFALSAEAVLQNMLVEAEIGDELLQLAVLAKKPDVWSAT